MCKKPTKVQAQTDSQATQSCDQRKKSSAPESGTKQPKQKTYTLKVLVMCGDAKVQGANVTVDGATMPTNKDGIANFGKKASQKYEIKVAFSADSNYQALASDKKFIDLNADSEVKVMVDPYYEIRLEVVDSADINKRIDKIEVSHATDQQDSATKKQTTSATSHITFPKVKSAAGIKFDLKFDEEKYRRPPGTDVKLAAALPGQGQTHKVPLDPIIRIYLKLTFKDPKDVVRAFPKDFELEMEFENKWDTGEEGTSLKVKTNEDGILTNNGKEYVEVLRSAKSFKLNFRQEDLKYVVCEKNEGDATVVKPAEYRVLTTAEKDDLSSFRAFTFPTKQVWNLDNSKWKAPTNQNAFVVKSGSNPSKFDIAAIAKNIGSAGANNAAVLELDMNWQFSRFTYYDRWAKADKKYSILPVMLKELKTDLTFNDNHSNWVCGDAKFEETAQCFPWIIQEDGKPKPDATTNFGFETKANTYIEIASDKSSRTIIAGTAQDTPNADRLRFYDLPEKWFSKKYFCRIGPGDGNDNKRFEDHAAKKATLAQPLTFCLDDIVLTDGTLKPLTAPASGDLSPVLEHLKWRPSDRIALVSHYFSDKQYDGNTAPVPAAQAAKLSTVGIYDPEADKSYLTKLPTGVETDRNYIADYPDWTRLAIAKGNMFDVFDKRVPAKSGGADNEAVGARAGVLYMPSTQPFAGIQTWETVSGTWGDQPDHVPKGGRMLFPNRPPRTKGTEFFEIQPFMEQRTAKRYSEHFNPANSEGIGRFDMALLRCCDYSGDKEIAVNLHYFRSNYVFAAAPGVGEDQFKDKITSSVSDRWNGDEGMPRNRAKIISRTAGLKVEVPVVWIGQAVERDISHVMVTVGPTIAGGRDNRNGSNGTGASQTENYIEQNNFFVSAHECGHVDALPDEYNERWDGASYHQLSLKCNTPGDPYEPDGRQMNGANGTDKPMMNTVHTLRNRYFWHSAEWVRNVIDPVQTFKVKLGTYDNYFIPPHETAGRSYTCWPIEHKLRYKAATPTHMADNRGSVELLLYTLGREYYTDTGMLPAGTPYDGILVVMPMLECTLPVFPLPADEADLRKDILIALGTAVDSGFNNTYRLKGKVRAGSPQAWTFNNCLIQFSPRYVVANDSNLALATKIINAFQPKLKVIVEQSATGVAPVTQWVAANPKPEIIDETAWRALSTPVAPIPELDTIATAITNYHAIDKADLVERITKLEAVIAACPVGPSIPTNNLRTSAQELVEYVKRCGASKELKIQYTDEASMLADVEAEFQRFFLGLIGIYKLPGALAPADMQPWLTQLSVATDGTETIEAI